MNWLLGVLACVTRSETAAWKYRAGCRAGEQAGLQPGAWFVHVNPFAQIYPETCNMNASNLQSASTDASATPELQGVIADLFASPESPPTATLHDLRDILMGSDTFISDFGELMHRQDRTALVIEVDFLIDCRGHETPLVRLLVN